MFYLAVYTLNLKHVRRICLLSPVILFPVITKKLKLRKTSGSHVGELFQSNLYADGCLILGVCFGLLKKLLVMLHAGVKLRSLVVLLDFDLENNPH